MTADHSTYPKRPASPKNQQELGGSPTQRAAARKSASMRIDSLLREVRENKSDAEIFASCHGYTREEVDWARAKKKWHDELQEMNAAQGKLF